MASRITKRKNLAVSMQLDASASNVLLDSNTTNISINYSNEEKALDAKEMMYLPQTEEPKKTLLNLTASTETNKEQEDSEADAMAPLFLFLSSSLNVELVYIILKSIT